MSNDRRVYESFYDIPFSDQYGSSMHQKSGVGFSQTEIIHLLISIAVLTLAFTFAFLPAPIQNFDVSAFLSLLPFSFLAIVTAFVCHELAHKYVGQKYGYWSEFRMFPQGLLFALIFSVFFGIVFAAPGAVQIYGMPNKKQNGHISVAGPFTNILIAVCSIAVSFVTVGVASQVFYFIGRVNIILALFNLLPFGPLDGRKVMNWRFEIWLVLFVFCVALSIPLLFNI